MHWYIQRFSLAWPDSSLREKSLVTALISTRATQQESCGPIKLQIAGYVTFKPNVISVIDQEKAVDEATLALDIHNLKKLQRNAVMSFANSRSCRTKNSFYKERPCAPTCCVGE